MLYLHSLIPPFGAGQGVPSASTALGGRQHAHDHTAKVGQDVALHVLGGDNAFHDFHVHGHRWKDSAGAFVDNPLRRPE